MHSAPERQFILTLAGLNPPETASNRIDRLLLDPLDWSLIQEKADLHGVAPLIYHNLKQLPNDAVTQLHNDVISDLPNDPVTQLRNNVIPPVAMEFFKQRYYENLARNMTLFDELKEILEGLNDQGVRVIVLKGAALTETVYKNPALRPMSDLDLLIRKEDLAESERVLLDLGYCAVGVEFSEWWAKRFGGGRLYVKNGYFPVCVDIHWNMATPAMKLNGHRGQAEIARIWNEARLTRIAGVDTWTLSVEDLILHTSVHLAAHHLHFRLIWLRDICELARQYQGQIDWEKIVEEAKCMMLGGPIYWCFKYAREWLGAPIPEEVLSELQSSFGNHSLETKVHDLLRHRDEDSTGITHHFYQYLSIPGIGNKGLFVFGAIFPGLSYLRNRYQVPRSKMVCLYYLYRPCYILYSASLALLKLVRARTTKRLKAQKAQFLPISAQS